jgi:hypothetical protein
MRSTKCQRQAAGIRASPLASTAATNHSGRIERNASSNAGSFKRRSRMITAATVIVTQAIRAQASDLLRESIECKVSKQDPRVSG